MTGLVFDIEEFAVYDGPGIRSVVFLKGCPLRCAWCHNPEGLSFVPQRVKTLALCVRCGRCNAEPDDGKACLACPRGCLRVAGQRMTVEETAQRVLKNADVLQASGGGVTFSGGEALSQADFVLAVREKMPNLHACIETSGYAQRQVYRRVAERMDLVIQDLKIMDGMAHKKWTGVDNAGILDNVRWLVQSGVPFRIRVPVIPGVNDTLDNMCATAAFLRGAKALEKVELLPYNRAAGAKYAGLGMTYAPAFDTQKEIWLHTEPFEEEGIECDVL